jgi:hypothetical protein
MIDLARKDVIATSMVSLTGINHLQGDFGFCGNHNIYFCATVLTGI